MPIFAGLWTISPNGSEIFIPQSLLPFEFSYMDPASPAALPMLPIPSHANVPTLLCEPFPNICFLQFRLSRVAPNHLDSPLAAGSTDNFQGRRCKQCQGHHVHDPRCPSLRPGYECGWCRGMNGAHDFNCNGFMP